MADADRLVAALLQQELDAAQRPYFGNPNLAAQGRRTNRAFPFMGAENEQGAFASMLRNLVGSGEAAYSVAHNLGAGLLGRVGGVLTGGLGENNQGPQRAAELTQQMSYEPRTPEARAQLGAVSDLIGKVVDTAKIPPWPLTANLPRVGSGGLAGLEQAAETVGRPMTPPPAFASPLTVYHGSPHKFAPTKNNPLGEFDATKIGTGQGAQSYGYGSPYLAENPKVAGGTEYRDPQGMFNRLTGGMNNREEFAHDMISQGREPAKVWEMMKQKYGQFFDEPTLKADFEKVSSARGYLYKADLPDAMIAKMLDWDKPLSQQPPGVQKALLKAGIDPAKHGGTGATLILELQGRSGIADMPWMGKNEGFLREAGIPGIRYLDEGSRSDGKGTSNYVVFPGMENQVKILERDGLTLEQALAAAKERK